MHPEPSILFEDEALVVVDKPAGLHTAPLRAGETGTLLDFVLARFPEISSLPGLKPVEPGLLHRLDRETSGIVVVARTGPAFQALRGQFESGSALKEYRAASQAVGDSSMPEVLTIESRFAPDGPGRRKVRLILPGDEKKPMAREAAPGTYLTEARIEARVEAGGAVRVLVAVVIRKGFRHQVRAHLSHLRLPILGDPLYGVPAPPDTPQRMYLHASGMTLAHPFSGELLRIVSPLPDEFRAVFQEGSGPFFSGGRGIVPKT